MCTARVMDALPEEALPSEYSNPYANLWYRDLLSTVHLRWIQWSAIPLG